MLSPVFELIKSGAMSQAMQLLRERPETHRAKTNRGLSVLHYAAIYNSAELIDFLCDAGADVNVTDGDGCTPLHWAAVEKNEEAVRRLLRHGADVHRLDTTGSTPLFRAAIRGSAPILRELIACGAQVTLCNKDRRTPLHLAVMATNADAVKLLLHHGGPAHVRDRYGKTPFGLAVELKNDVLMRMLQGQELMMQEVRRGNSAGVFALLEMDDQLSSFSEDQSGCSPLHAAAEGGQLELMTLFLERTAPIDARDAQGQTALHLAARNDQWAACRLLLHRGAAPNPADKRGYTPFHLAAGHGHHRTIKLLLAAGAEVDTASPVNGETALHLGARVGDERVIDLLFAAGANVTATTNTARTPLHEAALAGHEGTVILLLCQGADANARDCDGKRPLQLAIEHGHEHLLDELLPYTTQAFVEWDCSRATSPLFIAARNGSAELLHAALQIGCDIDDHLPGGETAVHVAARLGHIDAVLALALQGADLDKVTDEGKTALQLAREGNKTEMARMLYRLQGINEPIQTPAVPACPIPVEPTGNAARMEAFMLALEQFDGENIRALLHDDPALLTRQDGAGNTLYHYGVARGSIEAMLQLGLLADNFPAHMHWRNHAGTTPWELVAAQALHTDAGTAMLASLTILAPATEAPEAKHLVLLALTDLVQEYLLRRQEHGPEERIPHETLAYC